MIENNMRNILHILGDKLIIEESTLYYYFTNTKYTKLQCISLAMQHEVKLE